MDMEVEMEKNNIKTKNPRTVSINIKVTAQLSKWLKENKFSPTAILLESVKELGYKKE